MITIILDRVYEPTRGLSLFHNKLVYDTQVAIFRWGYKPTNITGGAHPVGKPEVIIRNYFFGGLLVKPMEGN